MEPVQMFSSNMHAKKKDAKWQTDVIYIFRCDLLPIADTQYSHFLLVSVWQLLFLLPSTC